MKRYILTGTPGCGKTSIIRALEVQGYVVVNEAATDVIAYEQAQGNESPWLDPKFIDQIITLQKQRELQIGNLSTEVQFFDRSPVCAYALAVYLGYQPSTLLLQEIERIEREKIYQKKVFFIDNLGFITPTEARKISYEESLIFERIHLEAYAKFGYECIHIPPGSLDSRVNEILSRIHCSSCT